MDERGESIKIFRRNVFLSQSAEKFLQGESLSVSLVSSIEQVLNKRGRISTISVENFLSHNAKKFRKGTLLYYVSENLRQRKRL